MKIFVLETIDNRGGAAQISWELRKKLKADGHIVNTFVRYKYSEESDVFAIPRKRWQDWLVRLFANDLTFARSRYLLDTKEFREADIVHCHNLHSNFFDLKLLIEMSRQKPVIWTLHDMWAFTGFAYNSITLRNPNKKKFLLFLWDNTPFLLIAKKRIYERAKLFIVTVSDWLLREAGKGILSNQNIQRIHNGIETEIFKPGNKKGARAILGLPQNKKIVGCGIKGWADSNKIIDSYRNRDDIFFVSVGYDHIKTDNKNFAVLPRTENRKKLATYFQALDLFLHPTPEDSFGLIGAEALSCGTPVVAYGVDAIPEVVVHKETGYVARPEDIEDARAGIEYILALSEEKYARMSASASARVAIHFSLEKMYAEYLALYRRALDERR